jgi:hypothetical protein
MIKLVKGISVILVLVLVPGCRNRFSGNAKKESYEFRVCADQLRFKLKMVIIPFVIDGDVGIPEHGEYLWIGHFRKNIKFSKTDLITWIDSINLKCSQDKQLFRIPAEIEKQRFKLNKDIVTEEQLDTLSEHQLIHSKSVIIVKTFVPGKTSGEEF